MLQVLRYPWTMCSTPTTVLWTSRILKLVVLLCSAQLPAQAAVCPLMDLIGTFLMEVQSNVLVLHTTELGLFLIVVVEQYVSIVTLGLPQQESSTVTYLMPMEYFGRCMWGYVLPPQVSPVQWRATCLYSRSLWTLNWARGSTKFTRQVCHHCGVSLSGHDVQKIANAIKFVPPY